MHLSRLEVTHWRGLSSATLEFGEGITVVGGPNESGKSSLRAALRAALLLPTGVRNEKKILESHRPWATKLHPKVHLDMMLNGEAWTIKKEFLRSKDWATLHRAGRLVAQDEEVQRQLLEALGSTADWLDVLWGLQGKLGIEVPMPESIKGRLASAAQDTIAREVIELEALIQERYSEYWTPKKGQSTRKVQETHALVYRAKDAVDEAKDALTESDRMSAELADAQRRLQGLKATRTATETRLKENQILLGVWEAFRRAQAEAKAAEETVNKTRQWLQVWTTQTQQVQTLWPESQQWQTEVRTLQSKLGSAPSRSAVEALGAQQRYLTLLSQREEQTRVESLPVPPAKMMTELRAAEAELRTVEARLKVGEMQARLTAEALLNATLVRDGVAEQVSLHPTESREWTAVQNFEVAIPGVGRLKVEAGSAAGDLSKRHDLQQLFDKGLSMFGATTFHELEQRVHEKEAALKGLRKVDPAQLAVARLDVVDADQIDSLSPEARRSILEALPGRIVEAEAAWKASNEAYRKILEAYQKLNALNPVAKLSSVLDSLRVQLQMAPGGEHDVLIPPEASQTWVDSIQQVASPWMWLLEQQEAELKTLRGLVVQPAGDEVTTVGLEALQNSLDAAGRDIETLHGTVQRTIGTLEGQGDLYSRLVQAEEALAKAEDEKERVWIDALAIKELYNAFQTARQRLQKDVVAPLQDRVNHRFSALTGPSYEGVAFDTSLKLSGIVPAGAGQVSPEEISFGTQEQLVLLTRICLAELLAADGERQLVVLDDNLVHTDDARMQVACRILEEAAERIQLIVFTCHPERYAGLRGAERVEVGKHGVGV